MATEKAKYLQIPIVSHKSEKPSLIFEEISSGKLYPKIHTFKSEQKSNKKSSPSNNNKRYLEISIIPHFSEKPSMVIEEVSFGKNFVNFPTSVTNYKYVKKSKKTEKNKKTSVIIHKSEKPTLCFEENSSGKLFSNIITSVSDYKENKKDNKYVKSKNKDKYEKKSKIIIHESEKPSKVFEETNGGNKYKAYQTSVSEYKEDKKKKVKNKEQKIKCEKTKIIVHESEKPSFAFEQGNAGKLYSNVKTSETDFGKIKKLKKYYDFNKIPIVFHKSEKPSIVFEEANTGIVIDFHHMI